MESNQKSLTKNIQEVHLKNQDDFNTTPSILLKVD